MFKVTEMASKRIDELCSLESESSFFRVSVSSGGCSGFQYHFDLDTHVIEGDYLMECHGARVVIDDVSLGFLENSTLDYVEDLGGASFVIRNPDATSSCGCGSSFSL